VVRLFSSGMPGQVLLGECLSGLHIRIGMGTSGVRACQGERPGVGSTIHHGPRCTAMVGGYAGPMQALQAAFQGRWEGTRLRGEARNKMGSRASVNRKNGKQVKENLLCAVLYTLSQNFANKPRAERRKDRACCTGPWKIRNGHFWMCCSYWDKIAHAAMRGTQHCACTAGTFFVLRASSSAHLLLCVY